MKCMFTVHIYTLSISDTMLLLIRFMCENYCILPVKTNSSFALLLSQEIRLLVSYFYGVMVVEL